MLMDIELFRLQYEEVSSKYDSLPERVAIHETVRRMINTQVTDLVTTSAASIAQAAPADIDAVRQRSQPLIGFSADMRDQVLKLKRFLRLHVYKHYRVHRMTARAERIIRALFDAFFEDPALLPPEHAQHSRRMEEISGEKGSARAVADYIAGMTDRFAIAEYGKLFDPTSLT